MGTLRNGNVPISPIGVIHFLIRLRYDQFVMVLGTAQRRRTVTVVSAEGDVVDDTF